MKTFWKKTRTPWDLWKEHSVQELMAQAEACHAELIATNLIDARARVRCRQDAHAAPPGLGTGGPHAGPPGLEPGGPHAGPPGVVTGGPGLSEVALVSWLRDHLQSGSWVSINAGWLWPVLRDSLPPQGLRPFIERHPHEFEYQGTYLRYIGEGTVQSNIVSAGNEMGVGSGSSGSGSSGHTLLQTRELLNFPL